ncbi:MAG: type ISP restriction/modification enzyme [Nitrosomonas sp.]|nr:type ISP restriction/modification enzyme [Nitrosomonas sp.]MDP1951793.1 type ISP restriction/modification enzyme [Nitrosomonas sp.]
MNLNQYIETIHKRFQSGIAKEHAYRADLESLIRELVPGIEVTNEPANVTDCGNPDYVITKGKIPVGFIEAKDIDKDLNDKQYKDQFDRYRKALDNLIITDYLWFQFYQNGEKVFEIRIGNVTNNKIEPCTENFAEFTARIQNFCTFIGQTIKSPKKLAEMMAAKAKLLQMILEKAIESDEKSQENTSLQDQYTSFKNILIHDLNPKDFADIYSQTLAYGMFAARLHDPSLGTFSRQEAAELIPKTNPFLRKLFQYVAGYDIDERIKTTVDNLADVFRATDIKALLKNFGKVTQTQDPIIHFYETFLAEYDPKLRKARGVWYTPEPVVSFIVRSVDEILKTEFGLKDGLADTSRTTIEVEVQGAAVKKGNKPIRQRKEVHKVQVLDPATGTGTFLAEVVKHIYNNKFAAMQGAWSGYVEEHLIPRLNGFEILMASYAMAHLKLDMLLAETGYQAKKDQRFNIFLTNSLEEHHPDTGTLFSSWLSTEANEANFVKRDTPVMVVMGNPPYSVSSSNKGDWIQNLLKDYKKDLNERNIQPLSDDYIKFIRYGQYFIDKNGEGILAYISNNSFIDGVIHRQMRKHLLGSFDKIYILDLHGNSKKKETAVDGSKDENVFDIMQGVSINIFVKQKMRSSDLAKVYQLDLYGKRQEKYQILQDNTLTTLPWRKLEYHAPGYFFVSKDFEMHTGYEQGFAINKLFAVNSSGIKTHRDHFVVDIDKDKLGKRIEDFFNSSIPDNEIKTRYTLKDNRDWNLSKARQKNKFQQLALTNFTYRPFDNRHIYYDPSVIDFDRINVMHHFLDGKNWGLITCRQQSTFDFQHIFISNLISDLNSISLQTKEISFVFPIYLYPESSDQQNLGESSQRKPNLNSEIVEQISTGLGLSFVDEKKENANTFAPIDLLDYIYAILHSPTYRETYKEFLKIDFPRIPYPKDSDVFWQLVKLGGQLRQIHLLESATVENYITSYPKDGDNIVTRKITKKDWEMYDTDNQLGRIWINEAQYFDQIPLIAWEFYIGGYQPAQKWLKDRTGRKLSYEDILHYQKIIKALTETNRLMQEIDTINIV